MDRTEFWTVSALLGLGTLLIRASFFYAYSFLRIPERLKSAFAFVPAAVLPALLAPAVVLHDGDVTELGGKERLVALAIAAAVCVRSENVALTLLTGMISLYVLNQFL